MNENPEGRNIKGGLARCRSVVSLLEMRAAEEPSLEFAYFQNQSITLHELDQRSRRISASLHTHGVKRGDKVAIVSHSNLDYLACEFGILKSGAVCVPINPQLKSHELAYLLSNSDSVLAFVNPKYEQELLSAQRINSSIRLGYYLIDSESEGSGNSLKALEAEGEEQEEKEVKDDDANLRIEIAYEDPCCIMYTSGTTGPPKGVIYENFAFVPHHEETYVQQMMDAINLARDDVTYLPFALYHILGQVHIVGALRNGGKIALAERFSATQFWNDARRYRATVLVHQGASIPLLLKQPRSDLDREHSARITVGAGVPNEKTWAEFEGRFGVKVYEHYAQTEGAFFGAGTAPSNRIGTIGRPYPNALIRIVDENFSEVKPGEPGQLLSRLKPGSARKNPDALYYKDPERSASRFHAGWFKSGDIVKMVEEGYLRYVGKLETFIRYRGENISPLQIESVLSTHPYVDECIAVGVPNPELGGDDIKVVISLKENCELLPQEVIAWCSARFPKYMIPRYIEFVRELKKTEQTKKIVRSEYASNSKETWDRFAA